MKNFNLFCAIIFVLLVSCSSKEMTQTELQAYINNEANGLKKTYVSKNGFQIDTYLLNPDILPFINKSQKRSLESDSLIYVMLSYSRKDIEALNQGDFNAYASILQRISFNMNEYCQLVVGEKDTAVLSNSNFINTFGTAPSNNVLLVFKSNIADKDYNLTIKDIGFGISDQHFHFRKKDILKLNNIHLKSNTL